MTFVIIIHVIICILLAIIILMQSGRGGGLTENFAAAESMFGAKTSSVLVRGTAILAGLFIVTCLSLAFLSTNRSKSLMPNQVAAPKAAMPLATDTATQANPSDPTLPVDTATSGVAETTSEAVVVPIVNAVSGQ